MPGGTVSVTASEDVAAGNDAETRAEAAVRIAEEVRHGHVLGETRLVKVTSLLNAFRAPNSPPRVKDVLNGLHAHGIAVHSGWRSDEGVPVIRRTGVLTLSVDKGAGETVDELSGDDTIRMSVWTPGKVPTRECPLPGYAEPGPSDVLWFDVDPPVLSPPAQTPARRRRLRSLADDGPTTVPPAGVLAKAADPNYGLIERRVQHVTSQLENWCRGLDEEMVRDLLRQDVQPKVETYGDENDGLRGVSVVAIIARETPREDSRSDDIVEQLIFQMVEIIVGAGWIVTCWHPSRVVIGAGEVVAGHPVLREPFLGHVRQRWQQNEGKNGTSGDLGRYLARSLVNTYDASHRMMERWVASWEVEFFQSLGHHEKADKLKAAAGKISSLLSMTGEFRRRLTAFEHARFTTTDKSWFPNVDSAGQRESGSDVTGLTELVKTADESFGHLSEDIRADINLLMLQSTAAQQESGEKMQRYLGKVTGLVLVPTLVAGLFGANTALPGGQSWLGFELMLLLMILSAVVVYAAIRRREK